MVSFHLPSLIEKCGRCMITGLTRWVMCVKVVTIGGYYEYLQHVFLLAQNDVDLETHTTTVTVYGVNMQDEIASLP